MKILVVRFSSIGDIVLTSPMLRCMHEQLANVEIHYATKKQHSRLVKSYPYVQKVHSLGDDWVAFIRALKNENFDFVLDLHNNLRSLRVKLQLRKPTASVKKENIRKYLLVTTKKRKYKVPHIVDRYFDAAKKVGVSKDGKGLDFFIPPSEKVSINFLPVDFQKSFIAFVIGGTRSTKKLSKEKIIAICSRLEQPILLIGGPEEKEVGKYIESQCHKNVLSIAGEYSLFQSASILKEAAYVISHDTGFMHIAAAFKKKIFSVWGNTVPEFGMGPYLAGAGSRIVEVNSLNCRPCSKIGYDKCPKGHFKCMEEIPEDFSLLK